MEGKRDPGKLLAYRWLVFAILVLGYALVYFHSVLSAAVAPEIVEAFHVSGAILGGLASAYLYPFVIMQFPAGMLPDSLGSGKAVTLFTLIAAPGAAPFGLSPNVSVAIFARILVGLGVAVIFIPTMKIFAEAINSPRRGGRS